MLNFDSLNLSIHNWFVSILNQSNILHIQPLLNQNLQRFVTHRIRATLSEYLYNDFH